jgi:hypothetical protein
MQCGGVALDHLMREQPAQAFQTGVDEEADVADAELGHFTDFLVAHLTLELEPDHLALVLGESLEEAQNFTMLVAARDGLGGVISGVVNALNLLVLHVGHAFFFSEDVEATISTDGEQPRLERRAYRVRLLFEELDKGVLHDISGAVGIAQNAGGIADQRTLEFFKSLPNQQFACVDASVS